MAKLCATKPDACPVCGTAYEYRGNIDVAPLVMQYIDELLHRQRDWLSHRYMCRNYHFFDVVVRDELIEEG